MSTNKKKRFRAANFTAEEVNLLIKLSLKEKQILENKQTDSEVWKLKSQTWARIAQVFNACSGQTFRSAETLRLKYEGLKKDLKKKVNKNKAETLKTGGGNPDYIVINGPEKELLEVLSLSVHGLPSIFDSDSVLPQTTITGEKESKVLKHVQELQERIPIITQEEIEAYDLPVVIEVNERNSLGDLAEASCSKFTPEVQPASQRVVENIEVIEVNERNFLGDLAEASCSKFTPEFTSEVQPASQRVVENIENINPEKNITGTWKNWSPGALKAKKHSLLTPKRKKGEERNNKIDNLLGLREELVRQQIHHTQQEEIRAREKHEREMELLDLEIKIKQKCLK